jgi:hypothetical protein
MFQKRNYVSHSDDSIGRSDRLNSSRGHRPESARAVCFSAALSSAQFPGDAVTAKVKLYFKWKVTRQISH